MQASLKIKESRLRVAMYYNNRDVRLEEIAVPEIGPGEILMKVEASGVCGTDVLEWYRIHKAPLVLGHEVAGTVAAVGEGVTGYQTGDRIAAAHHVPCNTCHWCLSGHETLSRRLCRIRPLAGDKRRSGHFPHSGPRLF